MTTDAKQKFNSAIDSAMLIGIWCGVLSCSIILAEILLTLQEQSPSEALSVIDIPNDISELEKDDASDQ